VEWALDFCRQKGLKKTKALETLLCFLMGHKEPVTWSELTHHKDLSKIGDPATLYRLLGRLESIELVRRLGSHERSVSYIVLMPGVHHDYIICKQCGKLERLTGKCPLAAFEKMITDHTGYEVHYHELELYGVCPACQKSSKKS